MKQGNRKTNARLAVIGIRGFPGVQGGAEIHCEQLIPRIARFIPCQVFRRKEFLTETSYTNLPGIDFVDLSSGRLGGGIEAMWHTFKSVIHLIFSRPDVVNVHNLGPGIFTPLLRLAGLKVVLTYHSVNYEHNKWSAPAKLLLRLSEKLSTGFANHIIFVSPVHQARFSEKIRRKSSVIPNGVTPIGFNLNTDFLERYSLTPGKYILAVGRLTPEKGFDDLIRAVNLIEDSQVRLVIAGSSDHNIEYGDYLKSLDTGNRTTFTGYTQGAELAQLYSHAALYVLSSHNEGFPMVLLEAMSHNLPIVATDIPAAHIIPLQSQNYCEDCNPEDMARVITNVLAKEERPSYDLTSYDWDKIAEKTIALYESLL